MYLLYIYTILHNHIKSHKYIYFTLTLFYMIYKINLHDFTFTSFVFYIYTYMNINGYYRFTLTQNVSLKPFTCKTLIKTLIFFGLL
jgi:hypothetical protein